jgi:CshA-type fibril repeat protein
MRTSSSVVARTARTLGCLLVACLIQLPLQATAATTSPLQAASAATTTTAGQDFWLAFPAQQSSSASIRLFISSTAAGSGSVSVPGEGWQQSFTTTPGTSTSVVLPSAFQVSDSDGVSDLGIHVTATTDVVVHGTSVAIAVGGFLGIPVEGLGRRYLAMAYGDDSSGASQLTVVSTEDDTLVTVTPAATLGSRVANVPYNVALDEGQVYQLGSETDVTGSVVESSAPVAVFGSSRCSSVPLLQGFCDHLVQQLPPTSAWGKDFLSVRLSTRAKGDTYRVLANEDDTEISVNGSVVDTIDAGEYWESILPVGATSPGSQGTFIQTTQPTLVAQYGNGSIYDGRQVGSMMMIIPPTDQYLDAYTFRAPQIAGNPAFSTYLNLVVPTDDVGEITLDGVAISADSFDEIDGSDYSGAQFGITAASHTLTGPSPFGAEVYEQSLYSAVGFPAGMATDRIYLASGGSPLTSTGKGTAQQSVTVDFAYGSVVALRVGDEDVYSVTVDDEGTYTLNSITGDLTFAPVSGYAGTTSGVQFVVTNSFGETHINTYIPTVSPDPYASFQGTDGTAPDPQQVTIPVPMGCVVWLQDDDGADVTEVTVQDVGVYSLDQATGVVTFRSPTASRAVGEERHSNRSPSRWPMATPFACSTARLKPSTFSPGQPETTSLTLRPV